MTPAFRAPDESQHVNSVLRLAEGGGWPAPGDARMLPEVLRARTVSGFTNKDTQTGNWNGGNVLPGYVRVNPQLNLRYFALFSGRSPAPIADRLPFNQLAPNHEASVQVDQMTQHPPLYYAVVAGVYRALGADDWRFDRALGLMRLVSVAMVMWTPLLCWLTSRRLTGSIRVSNAACLLPLGVPQLAHIGASVTNDALVIALGGVGIAMISYLLTGARSSHFVLALGVVLGASCMTKATLLPMILTAFLAYGVVSVRSRRAESTRQSSVVKFAMLGGVTVALGGWWYVVDLLRYGTLMPAGYTVPIFDNQAPKMTLLAFTGPFLQKVGTSFWGSFGYLELPLAPAVVVIATLVAALPLLAALSSAALRSNFYVLLSLPLMSACYLFYTTYHLHLQYGSLPGLQGRYLFVGLVPLAAAGATGLNALLMRQAATRRLFLPIVALCAVGMALYGLFVAFNGFWVAGGASYAREFTRMTAWSPYPTWLVVAVLAVCLAACVLVTTGRTPSSGEGQDGRVLSAVA